jgi:hypothetical protein
MFVYTPPPPSRRATELGQKVIELLEIYKEQDPKLSFTDVQQALRMAERSFRSRAGGLAVPLMVGIALFLAFAVGGLVLFLSRSGTSSPHLIIMIIVGLAVAGLAVAAVAMRR